jgi:5-methylcytosine-specific restriction protein B
LDSDNVKSKNKSGREYFDKDTESNWYLTEKGKDYQKLLIEDLNDFPETSDSQFSFITFHQSFSYEDFVEGIRPELNRSDESIIEYRIKDGIFKEICKKAAKDPDNNYVLIIDEINRGNISKIFGELITLLEDNKRTGEKEEITVKLPYSNDSFSVPNNVYIIGTMNSTDKSIALVDIALRRRFHFERINVDYELIRNKDAKLFLTQLNSIICAIKNPDYEIGHYYFMNVPETDHENQELKKVFSNQILPLLEDYFFNDWEALATILGRDSIKIEKRKKFVWDEDSGKFEDDGGDYDQIYGRCLKSSEIVFENTMRNLGIRKNDQEIKQ